MAGVKAAVPVSVDHVTVAGSSLNRLCEAFTSVGLTPEYGGVHSNGITHMALVGFDDGSYIELISTVKPGQRAPWWPDHIAGDAGPCGWCARAAGLGAESKRLRALGVPARGPLSYHRDRADGTRVEWELVFPDDGPPGTVLPFLIQDRTPRELRVGPSASVAGSGLLGISTVVIAVRDASWTAGLFEQVYRWTHRLTRPEASLGATVVNFRGAPAALAAPATAGNWLDDRIRAFGECPVAILLGCRDLDELAGRLSVTRGTWLGRPALWFDPSRLGGTRLGIIREEP